MHAAFVAVAVMLSSVALGAPPPLDISEDGTRLVGEDGKPLVLRGVNWGWWSCVESGDAQLLRAWGGNLIRICFPYSKIVKPGTDEIGGEGLALLDAMISWAEEAGVRYVLCCQETPGGCNTAHHCFGGLNALWIDEGYQAKCVAMWETLVSRYRDRKWLLAYELMNEPTPPKDYPVEQYTDLLLRNIDAIRSLDPQRFVVVSGWGWSDVSGLTDAFILPRPRLIYTFHCYNPGNVTHEAGSYPGPATTVSRWLANSPENWGPDGDTGWVLMEKTFQAPAEATHGQIMLRSDRNAGTAWFDDVALTCEGAPVDLGANVEFADAARESGWKLLRETAGEFAWDGAQGCAAPGGLRISGTDSYNAWTTQGEFVARPGATYTLSCRVKTTAATGSSYPSVAWFGRREETVDSAWLEARIRLALEFSARNRVPIWCGEFGCSQGNPDGSGVRWLRDVGGILNRLDIPWTHWNWRETTGRGSMAVWVQDEGRYVTQEPLAGLIRDLLSPTP